MPYAGYAGYPSAGTHFLVDLENVHSRWTRIFPELKRGDKISIFVSVPAHSLDILDLAATGALDIPVYFKMCENGRSNAMDFQIMCELGRLSITEPDIKYVMVTDDQCYRSVIQYMSDRNVNVEMFCPSDPDVKTRAGVTAYEPVVKTYRRILSEAGITESQDLVVASGILAASMAQPANRRKADCHNRFLKRYGKSEGELRYGAIRDIVHKIADEGPWPHPGQEHKPNAIPAQIGRSIISTAVPDIEAPEPVDPDTIRQDIQDSVKSALTPELIGEAARIAMAAAANGPAIRAIQAAQPAQTAPAAPVKIVNVTSDNVNKLLSKAFPLTTGDVAKAVTAIKTAIPATDRHKALEQNLKSAFGTARGAKAYAQLKTLIG